jgi:hypothetical protein
LKKEPCNIIENNLNIILDCFIESGVINIKENISDEVSDALNKFFNYILKGNYLLKKKLNLKNIFKNKNEFDNDDKNSIMSVSLYNELMDHIKKKWKCVKDLHLNLCNNTDNFEIKMEKSNKLINKNKLKNKNQGKVRQSKIKKNFISNKQSIDYMKKIESLEKKNKILKNENEKLKNKLNEIKYIYLKK